MSNKPITPVRCNKCHRLRDHCICGVVKEQEQSDRELVVDGDYLVRQGDRVIEGDFFTHCRSGNRYIVDHTTFGAVVIVEEEYYEKDPLK